MFGTTLAEIEVKRLHRASAWSPKCRVIKRRKLNQNAVQYVFEDQSILKIYLSGEVAIYGAGKVRHLSNWHFCNR